VPFFVNNWKKYNSGVSRLLAHAYYHGLAVLEISDTIITLSRFHPETLDGNLMFYFGTGNFYYWGKVLKGFARMHTATHQVPPALERSDET
jgi:hypothetical protein